MKTKISAALVFACFASFQANAAPVTGKINNVDWTFVSEKRSDKGII